MYTRKNMKPTKKFSSKKSAKPSAAKKTVKTRSAASLAFDKPQFDKNSPKKSSGNSKPPMNKIFKKKKPAAKPGAFKQDEHGNSSLHNAIIHENIELVKELLSKKNQH